MIYCNSFVLSEVEVASLWESVKDNLNMSDDAEVALRCVSREEMTEMNDKYRKKTGATNVLTFSYDEKEHDVALCMEVAEEEAAARAVELRDYVALLLVHAFLHAAGMDHEKSYEETKRTQDMEKKILLDIGFSAVGWK